MKFTLHTIGSKYYIYNTETKNYVHIAEKSGKKWRDTGKEKSWTTATAAMNMLNRLNKGEKVVSIVVV